MPRGIDLRDGHACLSSSNQKGREPSRKSIPRRQEYYSVFYMFSLLLLKHTHDIARCNTRIDLFFEIYTSHLFQNYHNYHPAQQHATCKTGSSSIRTITVLPLHGRVGVYNLVILTLSICVLVRKTGSSSIRTITVLPLHGRLGVYNLVILTLSICVMVPG
jgi:hypothetical protein